MIGRHCKRPTQARHAILTCAFARHPLPPPPAAPVHYTVLSLTPTRIAITSHRCNLERRPAMNRALALALLLCALAAAPRAAAKAAELTEKTFDEEVRRGTWLIML